MRAELRLERDTGTVVTTQPALTAEITRSFDEQAHASVRLTRDDWGVIESALSPRTDRLFVVIDGVDEFGGRFDDSDRQQGTVTVRLNSPEIDAKTAEPTADNLTYENVAPETIVTETIDAVPTLSLGRLDLSASAVSYTISHGSRSKVLYDLRSQVGAEFRYNSDFSVDVVDRLGADRDIVLSPETETIGEDFSKTVDERENVTHVVGLGGQSGPNQLRREAVAPSYNGGRKIYRRYENKEIIDGSRLQDTIDELVREYDGEPRSVDVETTVYGEELALGDRVRVRYAEEDLDRQLRVVRLTDRIGRGGRERRVTLSSRSLTRESRRQKRNDDLQRFNRGYGGFVDRDNFRAVERQPVGASLAATGEYPYPDDVVREETAELTVRSLPYRAYSSGAVDNSNLTNIEGQGFGIDVINVGESGTNEFDDNVIGSFTLDDSPSISAMYASISMYDADRDISGMQIRLKDVTDGVAYPEQDGVGLNFEESDFCFVTVQKDVSGHTFEWQVSFAEGDLALTYWYQTSGKHTHDPDPGVIKKFPAVSGTNADDELLASNVDVVIDGATVASGIGSGAFTETIDISDELSPGVNDIEIRSDSLGLVSAYVETELFRRGRTSS